MTPAFPPEILIIIGLGLVFLLAIIVIALYFANRQQKQWLESIERMLDKGQQVPREILRPNEVPPDVRRQRDLRHGILFLSAGLGIGLTLLLVSGNLRMAAWTLILLFLSAGNFLNWYLAGRRPSRDGE